MLITHFHYC